jgi:hypothetical protein
VHPGLLAVSAIAMWMAARIWWTIPCVLLLPAAELLFLRKVFRPVRSTSSFFWLGLLFGLSLFFSLTLMAVFGFRLAQWRTITTTAVPLDVRSGAADRNADYFELTGDPALKPELRGVYFAPTEESDNSWLVPIVGPEWKPEDVVHVWMETIDRRKQADLERPLKYAERHTPTIRTRGAMDDAIERHQIKSAPEALVVRLLAEGDEREEEAGGMVVIGLTACLLAWAIAACFWPHLPIARDLRSATE